MPSITIRNVVGSGVFAIPTTETAAGIATTALKSLLNGITWFYYDDARILVGAPGLLPSQELMFLIKTFFYNGSVIPNTNSLRLALTSALLASPDITSIGDISIDDGDPGDIFWHQWPEIEWIDGNTAIVQYVNNIPAGAQIELAKFTRHRLGPHVNSGSSVVYPDHIGKRYRRFLRLPVGGTQVDLSQYIRHNGNHVKRNIFRARFVWPAPPNTPAPAPGMIGPLAPYGVITGSPWEVNHRLSICMETAPSFYRISSPI